VPLAASIAASKDGLTPETTAHIADKLTTWIADRSRGLGRRAIEAIPPGDFRELLGEKLARALVSAEERSLPALYAAVIAARTESVWPVLTSGPKKKIYIPGILLELDASRPETLKAVLALLRSRRGATRLSGVQKLARLSGKRVDAALRSALEDSSKKVRAVAGILLAARGDPRGLRHLRLILEDDDADWILREICKDIPTSPTLAETLVGFMDDDEWLVQAHAVRTLGKCKAAEAVPALLDRLENPKWDHRGYAIESLGAIGDRGAVPALMTLLQTDDRWERERAVRALAAIGDERAVPALMDALNDDESTVSAAAVLALADLGAVDAANRILDYLSSDAEGLRSAAAEALGRLGIGRSVERLIERLRDDSAPAVRAAAAKALGAIGDDRAIDLLCDASKDEEWEIAQAAIDALGNFKDPRTRKALTAALESGDSAAAAKSLRRAGDQEAAPALTAIAEGQSRARAEAMEALWEISERLDEPA
jgi:HEAT repeat protein